MAKAIVSSIVDLEVAAKLENLSKKENKSVSRIIAEIISQHLKKNSRKRAS